MNPEFTDLTELAGRQVEAGGGRKPPVPASAECGQQARITMPSMESGSWRGWLQAQVHLQVSKHLLPGPSLQVHLSLPLLEGQAPHYDQSPFPLLCGEGEKSGLGHLLLMSPNDLTLPGFTMP